jgi:mycothiol synthase
MAGYCWVKRHDQRVGEIYVIAVDPAAAGQGIGRALLRMGLGRLADMGCEEAIVYVDEANRRATALYEAEGFSLNRTERILEKRLGG